MTTGAYISGAGHLLLILWMLLGGVLFRAEEPEMLDSAQVSLLSEAEFAALTSRPEPVAAQDVASPELPNLGETPEVAAPAEPVETASRPEIAAPSEAEDIPDKPDLAAPVAEVDAEEPLAPVAPAPETMSMLRPPMPVEGAPQALPRIAPVPQPEAPPEAETAPEVVTAALPQPAPEAERPPVEDRAPAAPEEAAPEIVPEAPETNKPPEVAAYRPPMRPKVQPRPEPTPERTPDPAPQAARDPEPAPDPVAEAVAAALAQPEAEPGPIPAGPPLSYGEVDALKLAMSRCWNKGALSSAAERVTVVVGIRMNRDGTPVTGSIRQISASGGDETAVRNAFETASRAIRMCGARGLPLPPEKYAHWAEIEMTFNPSKGVGFE